MTSAVERLTIFAKYLRDRQHSFQEWKTFMIYNKIHNPPFGITPIFGIETGSEQYVRYFNMIRGPSFAGAGEKIQVLPRSLTFITTLSAFILEYGSAAMFKLDYIVISGAIRDYTLDMILRVIPKTEVHLWAIDQINVNIYNMQEIYKDRLIIFRAIPDADTLYEMYNKKNIIYVQSGILKKYKLTDSQSYVEQSQIYKDTSEKITKFNPMVSNIIQIPLYDHHKEEIEIFDGECIKFPFRSPSGVRTFTTFFRNVTSTIYPTHIPENQDAYHNNVIRKFYLSSRDINMIPLIFVDKNFTEIVKYVKIKPYNIEMVTCSDTFAYQCIVINCAFLLKSLSWSQSLKGISIPPCPGLKRHIFHHHMCTIHLLESFNPDDEFVEMHRYVTKGEPVSLTDSYYEKKLEECFWRYNDE